MDTLHLKRTVAIKQCRSCSAELPAPDNFCRRCGICQSPDPVTVDYSQDWCTCRTKVLRSDAEALQLFSGQPLKTLTESVAAKTGSLRLNRLGALVIAVLVAIPMWLLIILLSPFDAYTSARAASSQVNIE
ncbi:MAG TPA: hypothetical protein VJQ56_12820 [Blastocatellia bacterium]|nr:hypothetical protein [Blastocatellia bacterium]